MMTTTTTMTVAVMMTMTVAVMTMTTTTTMTIMMMTMTTTMTVAVMMTVTVMMTMTTTTTMTIMMMTMTTMMNSGGCWLIWLRSPVSTWKRRLPTSTSSAFIFSFHEWNYFHERNRNWSQRRTSSWFCFVLFFWINYWFQFAHSILWNNIIEYYLFFII